MITRRDWQDQELPFASDMLMKTQFESATLLAFPFVAQRCHQQGGHPCADKGLKPMEEDNMALLAGQVPPQPITATPAALALCHGCGMLSPSSGSQQSQRLTQTVGATMGDGSDSSDDIPLNRDPWVPILSELVADMPNSTLLVRPDDSSGSSDNQLTRQDQLKQGGSAEAAQLDGDSLEQLIKHYGPLQEDSLFALHVPPQPALSVLILSQAVAAAAAAAAEAVMALPCPLNIRAALGLRQGRSRAARVAQRESRVDRARRTLDGVHTSAKKQTYLRGRTAAATLVLSMHGRSGRGTPLPTALPTGTTSIEYSEQSYTGTIPTEFGRLTGVTEMQLHG